MSEVKVNKLNTRTNTALTIQQNSNTAMTIDTSQNVLVGKTAIALATVGGELRADGQITGTRSGNPSLVLNRTTSDGEIAQFYKDASKVGSIYNGGGNLGIDSNGGLLLVDDIITPTSGADNTKDIGRSSARWKDLYLGGNIYLGGTGSANALDDYEEGTFTPVFSGSTSNPSIPSYSIQTGKYTKIGDLVYLQIQLACSGTPSGGGGELRVSNLPFVGVSGDEAGNAHFTFCNNLTAQTDQSDWSGNIDGGFTNIRVSYNEFNGTTSYGRVPVSALYNSNPRMTVSFVYKTT